MLTIWIVNKKTTSHCMGCNETLKNGQRVIDLNFGITWPNYHVTHNEHYHVKCFLEKYGEQIDALYKEMHNLLPKKLVPADPDGRIDGVLETM